MGQVAADIAQQTGVAVLVGDLADKRVDADFVGLDGFEALQAVAASVGRVPVLGDGVVVFVDRAKASSSARVVAIGALTEDKALEVAKAVGGDDVTATVLPGRLVLGGPAYALERVAAVIAAAAGGIDGWQLEVRVYRVSERVRRELGLGWTVGGRLGFNVGAGDLAGAGAGASLAVEAIGRLLETGSGVQVLVSSPVFVLEGGTARVQQGQRNPIPRRTVSSEGTVTVTGYEYVDSGFTLNVKASRVGESVSLALEPVLSEVIGQVEDVPVLSRSEVTGTVVLASGEWALLGGLEQGLRSRDHSGLPGSGGPGLFAAGSREESSSVVLVFVRAERVYGGGGTVAR